MPTRNPLPQAKPPLDRPTPPRSPLPKEACDCHVHLVGAPYALWEGRVEDPVPGSFDDWLDLYRTHLAALGCTRGVIVQSILYGADNAITEAAVARLGPGFCGVGLVKDGTDEAEIARLAEAGIRAVRLNYVHGGLLTWDGMRKMAPMLAAHGLHVEMLAHSHLHLVELAEDIPDLPVEIVFDHCAWPDPALGITEGQKALERLLANGQAWTKLSAANRHSPEPETLYQRLAAANPERILWGSDWPHLMLNGARQPDAGQELNQLMAALPDAATQQRLFVDNPARLYRF